MFNNGEGFYLIPVNCVGVMGCGLARYCKIRWPHIFTQYVKDCRSGKLKLGTYSLYQVTEGTGVILIPTKDHWRNPSELEWIKDSLTTLNAATLSWTSKKILHVPALGCGRGGLPESRVMSIIDETLTSDAITVLYYKQYQ